MRLGWGSVFYRQREVGLKLLVQMRGFQFCLVSGMGLDLSFILFVVKIFINVVFGYIFSFKYVIIVICQGFSLVFYVCEFQYCIWLFIFRVCLVFIEIVLCGFCLVDFFRGGVRVVFYDRFFQTFSTGDKSFFRLFLVLLFVLMVMMLIW